MRQGRYDSLCGVYSIVNGVSELATAVEKDWDQRRLVFEVVCRQLDRCGLLFSAVTGGISAGDYDAFIRRALGAVETETGVGVDVTTPFRGGWSGGDGFYEDLAKHIGDRGRSLAVLWVSGGWDHWTVVRSVSQARVKLIDSDGRDHLRRQACSIYPDVGGEYVLRPRQCYVLTLRSTSAGPAD